MTGPMPSPGADTDRQLVTGVPDDTTVIAYDDGIHRTWWCSDRDSFGAAVKFTPSAYPCQVVGTKAEVGYDDGQQVYLRVFDDNGSGGLPGTVLYEQQRLDIPHGQNVGFRDYDLTSPITIDSGDFYICFWQKNIWDLLFGTDTHFDSIPRQWWFFPDWGWVTPMGMDAADHLIRAKVLYSSGVEEELTGLPIGDSRVTIAPNPVTGGFATIRFSPLAHRLSPLAVRIYDAAGSLVHRVFGLRASPYRLDLRSMPAGAYLVRLDAGGSLAVQKLVVRR
jgi:hypothetical protein